MSKKRVHIVSAVNAANVTKSGDTITIRDVCGATDDIVMNGVLYPGDQLAAGAPTLNDKPAPAGHPKNDAGQHVSANSAAALGAKWIGAHCTNARHEAGRTLVDIVFNSRMAKASDEAAALLARLDAAIAGTNVEPIHVSTGLMYAPIAANGESRGKKYSRIATNLQYDHLAILLDEPGAGKPEDGVGMFVNSQGDEEEIEVVQVNSVPDDLRKPPSLLATWLPWCFTNNAAKLSFDQICEALRGMLLDSCWPREVYDDHFIWSDSASRLWKQKYTIGKDLSLAFDGQAEEVRREVTYESITNHQKDDPVKDKILAALNAAGIAAAGLDDAQLLSAYNSLVLKPVQEKLVAANSAVAGFEAERAAVQNAERDALATKLAVNSVLTVDDFKGMPLARLKELDAKATATAAPVTVASNAAGKTAADEFAGYDLNKLEG